jgi:hypothetical protein
MTCCPLALKKISSFLALCSILSKRDMVKEILKKVKCRQAGVGSPIPGRAGLELLKKGMI